MSAFETASAGASDCEQLRFRSQARKVVEWYVLYADIVVYSALFCAGLHLPSSNLLNPALSLQLPKHLQHAAFGRSM